LFSSIDPFFDFVFLVSPAMRHVSSSYLAAQLVDLGDHASAIANSHANASIQTLFSEIGLDVTPLLFGIDVGTTEIERYTIPNWPMARRPTDDPLLVSEIACDVVLCFVKLIDTRQCALYGAVSRASSRVIPYRNLFSMLSGKLFVVPATIALCETAQLYAHAQRSASASIPEFPPWAVPQHRGIATLVEIKTVENIQSIADQCTVHCNVASNLCSLGSVLCEPGRRDDLSPNGRANLRLLVSFPHAVKLALDAGFLKPTSPVRALFVETLALGEFWRVFRIFVEMRLSAHQALAIAILYASSRDTVQTGQHTTVLAPSDISEMDPDRPTNELSVYCTVKKHTVAHPLRHKKRITFGLDEIDPLGTVSIPRAKWDGICELFAYDDFVTLQNGAIAITPVHVYAYAAKIISDAAAVFFNASVTYPRGLIETVRAAIDTSPFGAIAVRYEEDKILRNAYGEICNPDTLPPIAMLVDDVRTPPCLAAQLELLDATKYASNATMMFLSFVLGNIGYTPASIAKHVADAFDSQELLSKQDRAKVRSKPRTIVESEINGFFTHKYKAKGCANEEHCAFAAGGSTRRARASTKSAHPRDNDIEDVPISACYRHFNATVPGAKGQRISISNPVDYFCTASKIITDLQQQTNQ